MSKLTYKLKNTFKSKETREIEAKMQFNQNKRAFMKYSQELDASIKNYLKMAREAELSGNHANALACTSFVSKLQNTQVKVQGLLQRFEMMNSMRRLSGVMVNFVDACAKMGYEMDDNIDLKKIWRSTADMDKALNKLDAMSDQMDSIFETIDNGMNSEGAGLSGNENDAEAELLLDQIMGRYNAVSYNAVVGEENGIGKGREDVESKQTEEQLRKIMDELGRE